jgi:hypothetical protein
VSQKQEVLHRLKTGPVCSQSFYNDPHLTHRLAARIYDLEQDGIRVHREPCRVHSHSSNAVRYSLITEGSLF